MKKIFFLISVLISFSVFANTKSKDNVDAKNNTNTKSNVKASNKANSKNNVKVSDKANTKSNVKTNNKAKNDINNNDNIEYSKVITVYGMVCAFCSNNLEKKFKKEDAIDQVTVELENKKVSVRFKKGKSIEDKKLKEIITSSGFKVVKIESLPTSG